jgi:biotin carboxylase
MRQTWRDAGVPVPAFRTVHRPEEVFSAMRELRPPLLLKSAWGAGSVGQMVLTTTEDIVPAWTGHQLAVADDIRDGFSELYVNDADAQVLVEEIVVGSTEGWYDEPGYGDYLSVEGLVAGGVYHPLCITSRLPTVPPFTEVSNNAPCVLPEHLQRKIEGVARRAVDALGLDTCGTHTEIKLAAAGELFVIESAARFGGCMVTREVETVFGFDPIGALCQELLGDPVIYPEQMWTTGSGAAASLALIAIDASGRPWSRPRVWSPENVAWSNLLSDQTRLEIIPGLSIASGSHIPPYNSGAGAGNWAGIFFLTSDTPQSLLADCHTVLNGMEHQLVAVAPQNKGE